MRIIRRMVHSKIWESQQVESLKPLERLLYIGMITIADDEGRLRGDGEYLRRHLFYRDRIGPGKLKKMRNRIWEAGLIEVYTTKEGTFISHPKWNKYQTLEKRRCKPSDFPPSPAGQSPASDTQDSAQVKVVKDNEVEDNQGRVSPARKGMLDGLSPTLRKRFEQIHPESVTA